MRNLLNQKINEVSDLTQLLLQLKEFLLETGFQEKAVESIKTATSELGYNIIKYAGTGEITLERVRKNGRKGIEIKAVDQGPGIKDLKRVLEDHYSTGNTLGLGLPGIKRLMDDFKIESTVGEGTTVFGYKWLPLDEE